jgi:thymidylate synthase
VVSLTPHLFHQHTVRSSYAELCRIVRDVGERAAPRGRAVHELTGVTLVVHETSIDAMPVGVGRHLNPAIGAAEALQLVGGVADPELLYAIAPNFRNFSDGSALAGAYGPRVRSQMPWVERQLRADRDTRQAVLTIFDPAYDHAGNRDVPCTVSIQFLIRRECLELHVHMRSNDLWWGWAYDAFQFTQLQLALAHALGVEPGKYVHHVGSLHLYAEHAPLVDELETPTDECVLVPTVRVQGDYETHAAAARDLLAGGNERYVVDGDGVDGGLDWYRGVLEPALHDLGRIL